MSNEDSKKYAYSVILIAASLIAVKAGISSQSEIKIPQTSVAVPVYSLWLALIFLYIPYLIESFLKTTFVQFIFGKNHWIPSCVSGQGYMLRKNGLTT